METNQIDELPDLSSYLEMFETFLKKASMNSENENAQNELANDFDKLKELFLILTNLSQFYIIPLEQAKKLPFFEVKLLIFHLITTGKIQDLNFEERVFENLSDEMH